MHRNILFGSLIIGFLTLGCGNTDRANEAPLVKKNPVTQEELSIDTNVIKVFIDASGEITADGKVVSLKDLALAFDDLAKRGGTVYYSRSNAQGEPPENAMAVMDLIAVHSLPVKFYTDKTFTEPFKLN